MPVARVGTEVAGYRVETLLARSGMSAVYRAEHPRLGTKVALKLLAADLSSNEAFRERFLRESRIAASLNHPSVVTIYDAGEWEGELFIAMRYVEGSDLAGLVRSEGRLSIERTVRILSHVADALDAAHAHGLVHRDVKPANILVESRGDDAAADRAYLSDFGLAKGLESRAGLTAPGELVGTVDYIAPEQIEGKRVDGRTDIYSLGCVVFECLSASPPFDKDSEAAVLWAHMHGEPPAVTDRCPELPADADRVLATALAKSPEDRFPTCNELISAVAATVSNEEAEGVPPTRDTGPAAVRPPARRRTLASRVLTRLPAAVLGVALLAVGAAAGALLFRDGAETASRTVTAMRTVVSTATAPAAGSQAFERQLLLYVPAPIRPTCRPTSPPSDAFFASVRCRPANGIVVASYSLARSGARLREWFLSQLPRAGIPQPASDERLEPRGNCATGDLPAVARWIPRGPAGHQELSEVVPGLPPGGRVLCYRVGPRRWLIWTDNQSGVYAVASARRQGPVYRWWRDAAGPGA